MTTENYVCGTGGWTGPLPGDPDTSNLLLWATTVYGGINVSWSYPNVNAHAVAYTRLYRSVSSDFSSAVERSIVNGSIFFDAISEPEPTVFYYWIRMVSVNGTIGELIGPASAVAIPRKAQTLEDLTGLIDASTLANSLKTELANITLLGQGLSEETLARINANAALAEALQAVESSTGEAVTYMLNEITARTTADSAMVESLNVLAAGVSGNAAAIVNEQLVRTTEDQALASSINLLTVKADNTAAAVLTEANARASADTSLANQITTTQSVLNNNIATVENRLETQIDTVEGVVTNIGALYTAKVQVNGLIGGFGIYNNGYTVEAGFDVDKFWIGRTGANNVKPFIVDGDTVYMDKARIRNADIDTLKIAGNAITVPAGIYIVDSSTIEASVTLTLPSDSGIVPVFVHYGHTGDPGGSWREYYQYENYPLADIGNGLMTASGYSGQIVYCGPGTHRFLIKLTNVNGLRRLTIMAQAIRR